MCAPRFFACSSFFEANNARAFGEDEPIAVFIERPAGGFRRIVPFRKRPDHAEPGEPRHVDNRFRAPREHDVGETHPYQERRHADGVVTGRARRIDGKIGPLKVEFVREIGGRGAGYAPDHVERGRGVHSPLENGIECLIGGFDPGITGADQDAVTVWRIFRVDAAVFERLGGRDMGHHDEPVQTPRHGLFS